MMYLSLVLSMVEVAQQISKREVHKFKDYVCVIFEKVQFVEVYKVPMSDLTKRGNVTS
jgi:hypothetical protein